MGRTAVYLWQHTLCPLLPLVLFLSLFLIDCSSTQSQLWQRPGTKSQKGADINFYLLIKVTHQQKQPFNYDNKHTALLTVSHKHSNIMKSIRSSTRNQCLIMCPHPPDEKGLYVHTGHTPEAFSA